MPLTMHACSIVLLHCRSLYIICMMALNTSCNSKVLQYINRPVVSVYYYVLSMDLKYMSILTIRHMYLIMSIDIVIVLPY